MRSQVFQTRAGVSWRVGNRWSQAAIPLADRHYSRRKPGSPQFCAPGSPLVLLAPWLGQAEVLWVTLIQDASLVTHAWPGAWLCAIFRNESRELSSRLISAAVEASDEILGERPPQGFITFVDALKTRRRRSSSSSPGQCFRHAGWVEIGETPGGHGRNPLVVLRAP